MRQQRIYIETHTQGVQLDAAVEEIRILRNKLQEYSIVLSHKDQETLDNRTQYLMKLKEIDE